MSQRSSSDNPIHSAAAILVGAGIILWAAGFGPGGLIGVAIAVLIFEKARRSGAGAKSERRPK